MNIRDALLEVHSKAQATKIAEYVSDDPEHFAELMKHMLGPAATARFRSRARRVLGV